MHVQRLAATSHPLQCDLFFAVFAHRPDWPWERLPSTYQTSAYVSMDTLALEKNFHPSNSQLSDDSPLDPTHEHSDDPPAPAEDFPEQPSSDLPTRVSVHRSECSTHIMSSYSNFIQEHKCTLKTAAERARITLKELESLTYTCSSTSDLLLLGQQLQDLKMEFQSKLPHEEGIIIRPAVIATALKTKRKYAHFRTRQRHCSVLTEGERKGRRRMDSRFRKRVGARADRLRKVRRVNTI